MKPKIIERFLTKDECDILIKMIASDNKRSKVVGDQKVLQSRTSSTHYFKNVRYISLLTERMKRILNVTTNGETLQGQYYKVNEEYKEHTDYFKDLTKEHVPERGNRTWTFMVYLNKPTKGGETKFPKYDITITPEVGKAVYWNSLHPDGSGNEDSLHAGCPVLEGEKYIITKWFRQYS